MRSQTGASLRRPGARPGLLRRFCAKFDPYGSRSLSREILGVAHEATKEEIKKAFVKLAKQYHPDHNPEGSERYSLIAR